MDDPASEIRHTASALAAVHGRLLGLIAQANRDKRWAKDGAASPAGWLVAQLGISHQTAASWSQVADRLDDLPSISSALASGEVSFDQTQALSRFATPEDEADLAAAAPRDVRGAATTSWSPRRDRRYRRCATSPQPTPAQVVVE